VLKTNSPSFGARKALAPGRSLPEAKRGTRAKLGEEFYTIDGREYYLHGSLEIRVIGGTEPFVRRVWTSELQPLKVACFLEIPKKSIR